MNNKLPEKRKLLYEVTCSKCHTTDEANFFISGPHIKSVCRHCGSYLKFVNLNALPSVKDIRQALYEEAEKDLPIVQKAIEVVNKMDKGFWLKQQEQLRWWKVYLEVKDIMVIKKSSNGTLRRPI